MLFLLFFSFFFFFFFNAPSPTVIFTLSLHDALPIFFVSLSLILFLLSYVKEPILEFAPSFSSLRGFVLSKSGCELHVLRSEEHTSELQSRPHLVCRLLLEKKKKKHTQTYKL